MTIATTLRDKIESLTLNQQQEVIDFVEFLLHRQHAQDIRQRFDFETDPAYGLWANRDDLPEDSVEYVRQLRSEGWRNRGD